MESRNQADSLDFSNTKEAYRSKSFYELLRHYFVFKALSYQRLVDNNKTVSLLWYLWLLLLPVCAGMLDMYNNKADGAEQEATW